MTSLFPLPRSEAGLVVQQRAPARITSKDMAGEQNEEGGDAMRSGRHKLAVT